MKDKNYVSADDEEIEDYYLNTGRKIADFCIGFFGMVFLIFILLLMSRYVGKTTMFLSFLWPGAFNIVGLVSVLGAVLAFRFHRRYIGIGMIVLVAVVPLLIFGACFMMLSGGFP